jgi:isopenicillin N synthase-like dioxygenase
MLRAGAWSAVARDRFQRAGTTAQAIVSLHGDLVTQGPGATDALKAKILVAHGGADPSLCADLPGFDSVMKDYFARLLKLGADLHRPIARDLGLPDDYFDLRLDRPMATLRLLHYPPASERTDGAYGAGAHTDYGNLTLLLTDDAGGLEVQRRDGVWMMAPPIPGAFICNIGDCLMRWTNDVYRSTPHRVTNPVGRERYSIAFFLDANADAMVEAIPSCVSPGERPLYAPITAGDYLASRFAQTYGFCQTDKT